ncbi:MAG: hypothetical protein WBE70_14430 [Candidatus Acidiferrum sp.]
MSLGRISVPLLRWTLGLAVIIESCEFIVSTSAAHFLARRVCLEHGRKSIVIRERIARANSQHTWIEFSADNADLLSWDDNILKKYYHPETLSSELAKRIFVFPDRE